MDKALPFVSPALSLGSQRSVVERVRTAKRLEADDDRQKLRRVAERRRLTAANDNRIERQRAVLDAAKGAAPLPTGGQTLGGG